MTSDATGRAVAVRASHLGKTYRLGERLRLGGASTRRLRREPIHQRTIEALDDVTFDVYQGENLGVVGVTGSEKSPFLKILPRAVVPPRGSLAVRGRVLPMLSVGAGFHAELTGRENVVLQGAILGVPRRAVLARMDDIMEFAELERHADTPLKRYSTGMQSRLSFAIGMRFPADIYIFDEVLAVVDGAFRERCLDEIQRLVGSGPPVLFVSHDLEQLARLCERTVWLDRGSVKAVSRTADVLDVYRKHISVGVTDAVL